MTSFTYYANIPNGPDNPSFDQPLMQTNSQSINGLIAVDHVTFNQTNPSGGGGSPGQSGGQHLQVTFNSKNTPAGTPTDPVSTLYTVNGVASTVADMRFQNANGIFPVNLIRAYGIFDTNGATLSSQSLNLSSSGWGAGTGYVMAITANAVTGTTYGVLVTANQAGLNPCWSSAYVISSATAFSIGFRRSDTGAFGQPSGGFTAIVYQL